MAIEVGNQPNIDKSNLAAYPNGQVKDDDGSQNGTPLIQVTMSDMFIFFDKLMRQAGIAYNNSFDNEVNGYQFVQAAAALASKSDFLLPLTSTSGTLSIPINLGILQSNEKLFCKAAADYNNETNITGSDSPVITKSIANPTGYKANDLLLLVNSGNTITISRLVTKDNFSVIGGENAFLQATDNTTELAGTAVNKATTPASNKYVFTQRVTDPTQAVPYLATETTPGIMSAVDKTKLDQLTNVTNRGWFSGVDIGSSVTIGTTYPVSGNITSATVAASYPAYYTVSGTAVGFGTMITVVMQNPMANTNYKVRCEIESTGSLNTDSTAWFPIWKIVNTTTFQIVLREGANVSQALKIHIDAIQL